MQKIGNITTTADANGEWTNGNVAAGTPPTIIDAAWLNTIQREIANVVTAAGLTLDPTNDAQLLAGLNALTGPGRLLNVQIFTSSGTYTPTAGTKSVIVEVQAGGGGGGGVGGSSSTTVSAGTGGGGGGYGKSKLTVAAATGQVVTVGGGGAGGNLTPTGGAPGGASSFGSLITCSGGSGGNGQNQATPPFTSTGVTGGTSTGGNICNVRGEASAHGVCVSASSVTSGSAGGSVLGSGGFSPANNGITPQAGQGYGGGGGSSYTNNLSGFSGAAGAPGIVIVWEYA